IDISRWMSCGRFWNRGSRWTGWHGPAWVWPRSSTSRSWWPSRDSCTGRASTARCCWGTSSCTCSTTCSRSAARATTSPSEPAWSRAVRCECAVSGHLLALRGACVPAGEYRDGTAGAWARGGFLHGGGGTAHDRGGRIPRLRVRARRLGELATRPGDGAGTVDPTAVLAGRASDVSWLVGGDDSGSGGGSGAGDGVVGSGRAGVGSVDVGSDRGAVGAGSDPG